MAVFKETDHLMGCFEITFSKDLYYFDENSYEIMPPLSTDTNGIKKHIVLYFKLSDDFKISIRLTKGKPFLMIYPKFLIRCL